MRYLLKRKVDGTFYRGREHYGSGAWIEDPGKAFLFQNQHSPRQSARGYGKWWEVKCTCQRKRVSYRYGSHKVGCPQVAAKTAAFNERFEIVPVEMGIK